MHFKSLLKYLGERNRLALSKAISMTESQLLSDRKKVKYLLEALTPIQSLRVGVTGAPGVGKSLLLQVLAQYIINDKLDSKNLQSTEKIDNKIENMKNDDRLKGQSNTDNHFNKVAILTVDPSSSISGGSILGDKTRMPVISNSENIFIRQCATAGHLGGVAKNTYNAIRVCEMETVGVGQSEMEITDMVDVVVLVVAPNQGDSLQAMKKGINETVDIVVVNKSELEGADETFLAFKEALQLSNNNSSKVIKL